MSEKTEKIWYNRNKFGDNLMIYRTAMQTYRVFYCRSKRNTP